jgi:2-polyprenyl-6-methoxyphenol hydroxylase-like FAD-dependent oxidoreductase
MLPDGRRIAMLMTDSDIAQQLKVSRLDAWLALLAKTRYVQPLTAASRPLSPPKFWPAASHYCDVAFQPGMLAVGDALSSFDPLSSQGIIKALRSSIFASYAIADLLLRGDESGIARYAALMKREFASYRETWRDYYRQEQRWPEALFWRRRH